MPFNAKNPLSATKIKIFPPSPIEGARGLFPMEDGWHDIDDNGNIKRLAYADEITNTDQLENKADKATTLIGYGITDAYTKEETDAMIGDIDAALDELHNYAQSIVNGGAE